jgi:hypothetical protein
MLASDIIAGAANALSDEDHVTWTLGDLIRDINSAQQQIAILRPDASSAVQALQLVAGTKQSIPAGARRLLGLTRNLGSDGNTPGKPITVVDRESLDLLSLYWHSGTGKTAVQHFTYDERTPEVFYVYPPVSATTAVHVEASISEVPAAVANEGDELALNDIYQNAVLEWVLYRAFSVETDSQTSANEAAKHHRAFYEALGMKYKSDLTFSPSKEVKDGD